MADDDAVVAQNLDVFALGPETGGRTLSRSGVTHEQIANAVRPDDARTMELDCFLLGEAVHDQEFV